LLPHRRPDAVLSLFRRIDVPDAEARAVRVEADEIDLAGVARGVYQLKIFTENSVQTKKILIQ